MKVQNKYMQTHLDDMGRLLYYRVTFPIPKEFALSGKIKPGFIQEIKSRYYYVNKSENYDELIRCINHCQIYVARWKISQLHNKIKNTQLKLEL